MKQAQLNDGKVYESTIGNNVWAPDAYSDGWNMLY